MPSIQLVERRLLVEGTHEPSPQANAALPSMLNCGDGVLLLVYRLVTQKNTADGTLRLLRSEDNGANWLPVPMNWPQPDQAELREYRTGALSHIGKNRIAMVVTWLDHVDQESPIANAETGGLVPVAIGWIESTDKGLTWSNIRPISTAPQVQACGNGAMIRLPDGQLAVAFETYKHWDDRTPWSARAFLVRSSDDGKTWNMPTVIAADDAHHRHYWDQTLHTTSDGALLSIGWMDDDRHIGQSQITAAHSHDNGTTWSNCVPIGVAGQFAELVELPAGNLLMVYVLRAGDPSIRMRSLNADGQTPVDSEEFILYSQLRDDSAAVDKEGFGQYMQSMSTWSFGWPTVTRLEDGSLLCAYYVGQGHQSSIWLARLKIAGHE
jgi:hypothetical protein